MKCIFIIDDSTLIRRALRSLLERTGWTICGEANNGQDGVTEAEQVKPDLVILDLSMPGMNGLQTARKLRKVMPAVPLVMVTDYFSPHLQKEAAAVGISAIADKSAGTTELVNTITRLLGSAA